MPDSHVPHATPFRLQTLGGLSLVDESETTVGQQRRRLALLALVAGARERGVSRDRLIALLSPESPTDSARHSLEQLIYYLRRSVGDDLFEGTDPLRLNSALVSCDSIEFERALESNQLEFAVSLYKGPFLDGFHLNLVEFEEWVASERARLARLHSDAIQRLAAAADNSGDRDGALRWWKILAALDPLSGGAALGLMRALVAAGDASGALRHARVHEALVTSELGSSPAPEFSAFVTALSTGGVRSATQSDTEVTVAAIASGAPTGSDDGSEEFQLSAAPEHSSNKIGNSKEHRTARMLAAVGIAAIAMVSATIFFWPSKNDSRLPPGLVAVLPFGVSTLDSSFAWMGEGVMELLTIRLAGEGGMQLVEPRRTMEALRLRTDQARSVSAPLKQLAAVTSTEHVIEGTVTGNSRQIILSASITSIRSGAITSRASAEGPPDSLPSLVDRLSAQLLGIGAGLEGFRLAAVASTSIPAVRAYLEGRAALRSGRLDAAFGSFRTSVDLDSSFALGGLALARTAVQTGPMEAFDRGVAIARARQDLLSPPDRALLGVTKAFWDSASELFESWNSVVAAFPEVPEMWYGLGDAYYRWGMLAGLDGFLERAEDAFNRGWMLDSASSGASTAGTTLLRTSPFLTEPLRSMIELAHLRGDVARVRALTTLGLGVDSTSDLAATFKWHRAMGDRDARAVFWSELPHGDYLKVGPILMFTTWTGLEPEDHPRAITRAVRRLRMYDPWGGVLSAVQRSVWLNGGRPQDARGVPEPRYVLSRAGLRIRVMGSLSWGADSTVAAQAIGQLEEFVKVPSTSGLELAVQMNDVCTVGRWRAAHGDLEGASAASARLRAADFSSLGGDDSVRAVRRSTLCASVLDAIYAVEFKDPSARDKLGIADSLSRTWIFQVCCSETIQDVNLVLARFWEKQGDTLRALQAVRRRGGRFLDFPAYLSSFLAEEGRLAAMTHDTVGARRAYRHYLMHRFDPEPSARPEVDRIRSELSRLGGSR